MAKKTKAPKKTGTRKKPSRPLARKKTERKIKLRDRVRVPRERPLPGMEDKRIQELDDIGHTYRENLETIAQCVTENDALRVSAMKSMKKHSKDTWTASGVVFTLKHGEDKLLVKQAKSKEANSGDREDEDNETDDVAPATTEEMQAEQNADDADDSDGDDPADKDIDF